MASVRFELRVEESELAAWRAEASARGVSVSEFVRGAVEGLLSDFLVAAGPPVVDAERDLADTSKWPVTDHAKVAKVSELRDLPGVTTAADLGFAPVAPEPSPVQARVVPWKREVKPDPRVKPR